LFEENLPFFRFTIQISNSPENQRIYAFLPRSNGGAWLIRNTSQGVRMGNANTMLAKLKFFLENELTSLLMRNV
jgi:hypothetical protein